MTKKRQQYLLNISALSGISTFILFTALFFLIINMFSIYDKLAEYTSARELWGDTYAQEAYVGTAIWVGMLIVGFIISVIPVIMILSVKSPFPELEKERLFWGIVGLFMLGWLAGLVYGPLESKLIVGQRRKLTGDSTKSKIIVEISTKTK